jgi:hypothetical protein
MVKGMTGRGDFGEIGRLSASFGFAPPRSASGPSGAVSAARGETKHAAYPSLGSVMSRGHRIDSSAADVPRSEVSEAAGLMMSSAAAALAWLAALGFGLRASTRSHTWLTEATSGRFWASRGTGEARLKTSGSRRPFHCSALSWCTRGRAAQRADAVAPSPRRRRAGICTAAIRVAFWIGFALPFGPVLGAPRTALLVIASYGARSAFRVRSLPGAGG